MSGFGILGFDDVGERPVAYLLYQSVLWKGLVKRRGSKLFMEKVNFNGLEPKQFYYS